MKGAEKRILIVDDNLSILNVLSDVLEYSGYSVNTLSSAEIVFEKINDFLPDLILLDVMLGNFDGREICKKLKQKIETNAIPVILISAGYNFCDSMSQTFGPNDFVAKPFDLDVLLNKIEQHLVA